MSTIELDYRPLVDDEPHRDRIARVARRARPWLTCAFVALMYMLATNDPNAVTSWQEQTRDNLRPLLINVEGGRAIRQIAFVLLGLWGVASFLRPAERPLRLSTWFAFPLIALLAWAFASELWSVDRAFTAKRLIVLACVASAIAAFVRHCRARDLPLLALVGCCTQLAASVPYDFLYATGSSAQNTYRFSGLQHPNHSGITAVLLIVACAHFFDRTRHKRYLAIALVGVAVLVLTKSRSSLAAGLCALALYGALRCSWRTLLAAAMVGVAGLSALVALESSGVVGEGWMDIVHMGRRDAAQTTLTGRPMVWAAAFEVVGDEPTRLLTGAGYDSFWTPETASYVSGRLWFGISEGHNAYLDMLLSLGVVGVICFATLVAGGLGRYAFLARRNASAAYAFCAAVLAFAVVHGLTESTMTAPNFATFIVFAAVAFLAFRAPRAKPIEVLS